MGGTSRWLGISDIHRFFSASHGKYITLSFSDGYGEIEFPAFDGGGNFKRDYGVLEKAQVFSDFNFFLAFPSLKLYYVTYILAKIFRRVV